MTVQDRSEGPWWTCEERGLKLEARYFLRAACAALAVAAVAAPSSAAASDFSEPWKQADRALVLDAYEYNSIDWAQLVTDKRVVGFIGKASDGLSPPYSWPLLHIEKMLDELGLSEAAPVQ